MTDPILLEPTATPTAPPEGGAVGRLIRVFYEPAKVFAELAARPSFVAALLVLVTASFAVQAVVTSRLDLGAVVQAQLKQQGRQLTDDQMAQAEKVATIATKVTVFTTPLTVPLLFAAIAGLYLGVLRMVGSDIDFRQTFAVTCHAALPPTVLGAVLGSVVAVSKGMISSAEEAQNLLKSSLGAVLPEGSSPMLQAVASTLDVFNLWQWFLLAIGLSLVGRVTRGKAVAAIASVWGLWVVVKVGLAALR